MTGIGFMFFARLGRPSEKARFRRALPLRSIPDMTEMCL
jgi:hypothetical protein